MKTFELIEDNDGVIKKVLLNSGEYFETAKELYEWCLINNEKIYGEDLHNLTVAMNSLKEDGIKVRILSSLRNKLTARMKMGKSTFVDVSEWKLNIRADEESLLKIKSLENENGYVVSSPAAEVNNEFYKAMGYKEALKRKAWAPLPIEGYLCSSKYPSIGFKPAYSGGLLSSPANPNQIYKNVSSFDITSAYPYAALTTKVPMGESIRLDKEDINKLKITKGEINVTEETGFIGLFKFTNVIRKKFVRCPMIKEDDKEYIEDPEFDRYGLNFASSVTIALSPADLKLFSLQYSFKNYRIIELVVHQLGLIPKQAEDFIKEAYVKKNEKEKGSVEREKAKTALNTIVGFWGSDPFISMVKKEIVNGIIVFKHDGDLKDGFAVYSGENNKVGTSAGKPRVWDFRWAVYAVAENRLRMGLAEKEFYDNGLKALYMDTDCIKVSGDKQTAKNVIEKMNKEILNKIDFKGLGLWVDESDKCDRAVFRGPKVYFTEDINGNRTNTVSGVEKSNEGFNKVSLEFLSNFNNGIKITLRRRSPAIINNDSFGAKVVYALRDLEITY